MKTLVYLLRHGATAANRDVPYRLQGASQDLELDETGILQAERAARALGDIELAAVYSSPLLRARQTAMRLAYPRGLDVQVAADLAEANVGAWGGLTWDEVNQRYPELYARFMADPGVVPYLDGESFQDAQNRCAPALRDLANLHPGQRIAVVGHNVVNRAILAACLNMPISQARSLAQSNGGINVIEYDQGCPKLIAMNANLHLEGVA